jgi:hypothetical protein
MGNQVVHVHQLASTMLASKLVVQFTQRHQLNAYYASAENLCVLRRALQYNCNDCRMRIVFGSGVGGSERDR